MIADLVARSLLAARPDPTVATRGRYALPRLSPSRADLRRAAKAMRPIRLGAADPAGSRAERRAAASPAPPAQYVSPAERAVAARYRARVAQALTARRDAAQAVGRAPFTTTERRYQGGLVFRSTGGR